MWIGSTLTAADYYNYKFFSTRRSRSSLPPLCRRLHFWWCRQESNLILKKNCEEFEKSEAIKPQSAVHLTERLEAMFASSGKRGWSRLAKSSLSEWNITRVAWRGSWTKTPRPTTVSGIGSYTNSKDSTIAKGEFTSIFIDPEPRIRRPKPRESCCFASVGRMAKHGQFGPSQVSDSLFFSSAFGTPRLRPLPPNMTLVSRNEMGLQFATFCVARCPEKLPFFYLPNSQQNGRHLWAGVDSLAVLWIYFGIQMGCWTLKIYCNGFWCLRKYDVEVFVMILMDFLHAVLIFEGHFLYHVLPLDFLWRHI